MSLFLQIEDFGVAKTEKDIGYYAGFIGEIITCKFVHCCLSIISTDLMSFFATYKRAHSCLDEH